MARKQGGKGLLLLGLLAGATIGGAVGLVYTSSSGEQNRKHLEEWVNRRTGEVRARVEEKLPGS
jgi:gas vesicle protein